MAKIFSVNIFTSFILLVCCLAQESSLIQAKSPFLKTQFDGKSFTIWKAKKEEEWARAVKLAEELKQSDLLRNILISQEALQKNPEDHSAHEELLFSYNYLREKRGLAVTDSISSIDNAWLCENQCEILEQANNKIAEIEGLKVPVAKTEASKKIYLLHEVIAELNTFYNQPYNRVNNVWLFCDYNQLRKLVDEAPIATLSEIDRNWLEDIKLKIWKERAEEPLVDVAQTAGKNEFFTTQEKVDKISQNANRHPEKLSGVEPSLDNYTAWKEEKRRKWDELSLTENQRHYDLINTFYDFFDSNQQLALNAYNYLREMYNNPLVHLFSQIDVNWLQEIVQEMLHKEGFVEPTFAQKQMAQEVQKALNLKQDILVAHDIYHPEHSRCILHPLLQDKHLIALGLNPDLNDRLFYIYHELGHLVNNDLIHKKQIHKNERTYYDLLDMPEFKKDIERINRYKALAAAEFDESTELGRQVVKILKQYNGFWIPPTDKQLKARLLYLLGTEKRADLFAIKYLYKQNKINAILNRIADYGRGNRRGIGFLWGMHPVVLDSRKVLDIHPSDFERALYMAGFLVDKGIDINAAFKEWEKTGTCIAAERYYERKRALPDNQTRSSIPVFDV